MNDTNDALRRFGDRLEWVFPTERAADLIEVIAPLFWQDVSGTAPESDSRAAA